MFEARSRADESLLRIDTIVRPHRQEHIVIVSGDLDSAVTRHLRAAVETGLDSGLSTTVRLDGVGVFGSAAARSISQLLDGATSRDADLLVEGAPPVVVRVLDLVGVADGRIRPAESATFPLSPVVFDAVMASGALRSREPLCVTTHDVNDPRIVFVNDAFTKVTGYSSDDMVGRSPRDLQGALTDRAVLDELRRCLESDETFHGETVNYRADGTPFRMNWRIVPVSYGARRFFMALQRDVTSEWQLRRYGAARARMTRLVNAHAPPLTRGHILEALGHATGAIVEAADVAIATAVTDADNAVLVTNLEGSYTDPAIFDGARTETYETDGTVRMHLPFVIDDAHTGHVYLSGLHPDWLALIDIGHLEQLCADCVAALQIATV